jgi:hypothetical protein
MPDTLHGRPVELLVVQAAFGDCLIVTHGPPGGRRALLIDGGPAGTFARHLEPVLGELAQEGVTLDAVVLSHIDNDHVDGLLELFRVLRDPPASPPPRIPPIGGLWHNAFGLSAGGDDLAPRVRAALQAASVTPQPRGLTTILRGFPEGDALRQAAVDLGIAINAPFGGDHVLLDGTPVIELGDLRITVVGPSRIILQRLRRRWLRWLGARAARPGMAAAPTPDTSIPNMSSIVLLVQGPDGSLLLTGDARGDQVVAGLRERGLLPPDGTPYHVDVLKVPHHGSARNSTAAFYRQVTADRYVVSADGRYGNPDLPCLLHIVDAAHEQGRRISLVVTNETEALRELQRLRPSDRHGYAVELLPADQHAAIVPVRSTG